jgi:hypothetical protein
MDAVGAIALAAPFVVLFGVPSCLIAARKGFAWYWWALAHGVIGLIAVACLPSAKDLRGSEDLNRSRRKTGNMIGAALSVGLVLTVAWIILSGPRR